MSSKLLPVLATGLLLVPWSNIARGAGTTTGPLAPSQTTPVEVPDQLIVSVCGGAESVGLDQELATHGARLRPILEERERCLGKLGLKVVDVPNASRDGLLVRLRARSDIARVVPVYRYATALTPADPYFGSQYHHALVGNPAAWDRATGAVTIAVCDTGVDPTHPDLAARLLPGFNFYGGNTDTSDATGHGTAVAGVAAAIGSNSVGVTGVAFTSSILPVRVSDANGVALSTDIAASIQYAADRGARVINVSFAPLQGDAAVITASSYAASRRALVVLAAGNTGARVTYASRDEQLFVSATDASDALATFSTVGPSISLGAPGVNVLTCARGGAYGYHNGTSFSAPIVTGVAALCMSVNPGLSSYEVKSLLQKTAKDLGAAGRDESFGYGRVDAARAVSAAAVAVPDSTAPTASITSPAAGTVVTKLKSVSVTASVSDNVQVASARLLVDGAQVGATLLAAPFTWTWSCGATTVPRGKHVLQVLARDTAGNEGASVAVQVTK